MSHADAIPLLDLAAQNHPLLPAFREAFERVVTRGQFILGPEVDAFERAIAEYLGVQHAIGVSSGTDALLVGLMALGVGPGDEVLTTPFSFFATAGCIARVGATPVFVDIDPSTFNLDVTRVSSAITSRTRAIMPVHLFGQPCAMKELQVVACEHGLPIIEDAAQAVGARTPIGPVGGLGALAAFSFFPSKNLGAFGDAGLVTTNDATLAARVRLLRSHGAEPKYYNVEVGGNFRLDALQAAILTVKLPYLDGWAQARMENARAYDDAFRAANLPDSVLRLPSAVENGHVWNQYTLRTPRRDALRAHLTACGIGSEIYYPVPLHRQRCFTALGRGEGSFPEAERCAREALSIPIFPELGEQRRARVVREVLTALGAG